MMRAGVDLDPTDGDIGAGYNLGDVVGASTEASANKSSVTTTKKSFFDFGFWSGSNSEQSRVGSSGISDTKTKEVAFAGIYENEQSQSQSVGAGGVKTENSAETSFCCLTVGGSEEIGCCTKDNCCSYEYSLNCCGEGCNCEVSTTCCFNPIIHCSQSLCHSLPSLDDCGNCVAPMSRACSSLTDCLPNLNEVSGCISSSASILGECLDALGSINLD